MKKVLFKLVAVMCALLAVTCMTTAYAAVGFTSDGAADRTSVYVAGSPDSYPAESYDEDAGTYTGACSAFLTYVAEKADLSFAYIRSGKQDRRETLAKNNQVDLFFAFSDESGLLKLGADKVRLFSITKNGTPVDVYCVFTSVSGEKERAAVRSVAESLTKDDIARFFTADSSQVISRHRVRLGLIVLAIALFVVLAVLIIVLSLFFKRRQKKEAFVDNATDIGNKNYFMQMYGSTISDRTRELYYVVHFAFAIDWVNNNYGTDESDEVLKYAADTITQRLRDNEFCARIGGGSFAAAIYSNGVEQVERRVEEILRVLNAYCEKYLNGESRDLFHAGICALAIDDKNAEKVLYNADQAYHRAVESKKAYVFVNHDVLNEYQTKVSIREQAGPALEQHAFTPYVQFIVNGKDGKICGGELLSRWENRLYGLLGPASYIPILQDMGLIVRHDLLMLEEACKLLEQWHLRGKDYFLTCNLTRVTVSDKTLVEKVLAITEQFRFPKDRLVLEVTENSLEDDKESALQNIYSLKARGFRVALDDFSSGYTTVSNLYEYAVDLVKLDRQMILDADRDHQAAALLKEITRMCHELHIRVLAEGVENESQAQHIRFAECDYIQGYYYARALPIRELNGFEESYKPKEAPALAEPVETENTAADNVAEQPETPVEQAQATTAEQQVAAPVEQPAVTPAEPPVVIPAERAQAMAVGQPEILVVEQPETTVEQPQAAPAEQQVAAPVKQPAVTPAEPPVAAAVEQPQTMAVEQPVMSAQQPVAAAVAPQPAVQPAPAVSFASEERETPKASEPVTVPEQQTEKASRKNMLHIQYGPYTLDLPGNIDITPVADLLRAIQDKMD